MAFLYLTRMVLEGIDMSDGIVVPKGRILVKEIEEIGRASCRERV